MHRKRRNGFSPIKPSGDGHVEMKVMYEFGIMYMESDKKFSLPGRHPKATEFISISSWMWDIRCFVANVRYRHISSVFEHKDWEQAGAGLYLWLYKLSSNSNRNECIFFSAPTAAELLDPDFICIVWQTNLVYSDRTCRTSPYFIGIKTRESI